MGPLLRDKIIHAKPKEGDYYVVYLWNYSSDYIANILSKFDHIQFKIFDSKARKVLNKKIVKLYQLVTMFFLMQF